MRYAIDFTSEASDSVVKYRKSNPILFKKIMRILPELEEHPRTGTGHPEPLKGGKDTVYSRRITANHRLVYEIRDEKVLVLVLSVEEHYGDK